jgi:hypothetical protein
VREAGEDGGVGGDDDAGDQDILAVHRGRAVPTAAMIGIPKWAERLSRSSPISYGADGKPVSICR